MRIIAGNLGGRNFDSPENTRTHPMSDKIKGALFNSLGDITGLTVLDAFSGSGALSYESISRGAKSATIIEQDSNAQKTIKKNIVTLSLTEKINLISGPLINWLEQNPKTKFDLILVDPPHDNLQLSLLQKLSGYLPNGGVLVLSWPTKESTPEFESLKLVKEKKYGNAQLAFYK